MSEEWALHKDRRRASSFGDDPEAYDRVRPPYPAALIDVLVAEQPHAVLDVGCGTGIVAAPVPRPGLRRARPRAGRADGRRGPSPRRGGRGRHDRRVGSRATGASIC